MFPQIIEKLISQFSRFPGVGQRSAARFVFYLLRLPQEEIDAMLKNIADIKKDVIFCESCYNIFSKPMNPAEASPNLCSICADAKRDKSTVCVVEKETDINAIEKIKRYNGVYFVLGGTIFTADKNKVSNLRLRELENKIKHSDPKIKEVILGFNATLEGDATALYLARFLREKNIKVTRFGRGLSSGTELEYADEETLIQAIDSRK